MGTDTNFSSRRQRKAGICPHFFALILLTAVTAALFTYSLKDRKVFFGTLSAYGHQWLTASAMKFTHFWLIEGAATHAFAMTEEPPSVEFPEMSSRWLYYSYPPGTILPLYVLCKVFRTEPTAGLVMGYNLAGQFLMTLFLALAVYIFFYELTASRWTAFLFALIPIPLQLFLPFSFYALQNIYFADTAVLCPFIGVVCLEVYRQSFDSRVVPKWVGLVQAVLIFWGTFTEWLFCFLVLAIWIKRLLTGELGGTFKKGLMASCLFVCPVILALGLYAWQLVYLGVFPQLVDKFYLRTGLGSESNYYAMMFTHKFWKKYMVVSYGKEGVALIWISFTAFWVAFGTVSILKMIRKPVPLSLKRTVSLMALVLLPCFAHTYALRNHAAIHDFSTLKFAFPLIINGFILVPLFILQVIFLILRKEHFLTRPKLMVPLALILLACSLGYISKVYPNFRLMTPPGDPTFERVGRFIRQHTDYHDVVFSPHIAVKAIPPHTLAYSLKRVYQVDHPVQIYTFVQSIKQPYRLNILIKADAPYDPLFDKLLVQAKKVYQEKTLQLYQFSGSKNKSR